MKQVGRQPSSPRESILPSRASVRRQMPESWYNSYPGGNRCWPGPRDRASGSRRLPPEGPGWPERRYAADPEGEVRYANPTLWRTAAPRLYAAVWMRPPAPACRRRCRVAPSPVPAFCRPGRSRPYQRDGPGICAPPRSPRRATSQNGQGRRRQNSPRPRWGGSGNTPSTPSAGSGRSPAGAVPFPKGRPGGRPP